ncbi:MAG TPA: radical SAM family heme chaperone HemW [Acidobacteriaceae bacterium]|jgi:oxygen-independent coproporphyrinogen-3 oxidase|nr:radical SAM family heme chaperone HemW [Acidobacteriaceae bacterium]
MGLGESKRPSPASTLGVYVSVPFCRAKCSFCNFASGVSSPHIIEDYVTKLCQEITAAPATAERLRADLPHAADTVYFGGGTPSLLEPEQLRRVFTSLRQSFAVDAGAEITLEAAPGQITDAVLAEAQRQGVNRISLGVQSFVDRESAAVGRSHTERDCTHEILRLQAAGIANVGADLIAGLPYQTSASWQHSLDVATSIGLTHLSIYMLEIDEDSRLGREVMAGGQRFHAHGVPADEASAAFYETACAWLPQYGFPQYEISNFAPPSRQSRHNRKYWQRDPYIGFGLDAHSMLLRPHGAVRFANPEELAHYGAEKIPSAPVDVFQREAFEETIFLGLRMNEGLSLSRLRDESPRELFASTEEAAREMIREGLMIEQDERWQLTLRGRLLSNDVFTNLLMGVAV